jgi:hypothetical protein
MSSCIGTVAAHDRGSPHGRRRPQGVRLRLARRLRAPGAPDVRLRRIRRRHRQALLPTARRHRGDRDRLAIGRGRLDRRALRTARLASLQRTTGTRSAHRARRRGRSHASDAMRGRSRRLSGDPPPDRQHRSRSPRAGRRRPHRLPLPWLSCHTASARAARRDHPGPDRNQPVPSDDPHARRPGRKPARGVHRRGRGKARRAGPRQSRRPLGPPPPMSSPTV